MEEAWGEEEEQVVGEEEQVAEEEEQVAVLVVLVAWAELFEDAKSPWSGLETALEWEVEME